MDRLADGLHCRRMKKLNWSNARVKGKPHIAFVLPGLRAGGSEHIVSLLCNHFSRRGWSVSLFAFEEPGAPIYYPHDPAVRIAQLGYPAARLPLVQSFVALSRRIGALRKALQDASPDLVVSFLTRTNVISILAAGPLRLPVIVSERNNPARQRHSAFWSTLRRLTYARAHGLVTMTQGAMNQFPKAIRRRQWVIPNPAYAPVEIDPGRPCGKQLVAVGRLVRQKGFDLLLDAFARVADEVPGWSLVIWGEGPEREKLQIQRDSLGLQDRVTMPGVTEEHGAWLKQADIFILSSRFEGWGIVIGEAIAAGIPTISFDCRWGPAEMMVDGVSGLLVRDGDVAALGDAIARLCADDSLRRRLSEGARIASKRFTIERVLLQWEDVLIQALSPDQPVPETPRTATA